MLPNDEPLAMTNSRENLDRLLTAMIEQPERRTELVQQVEAAFGQDKAVMVLDMSGFSRTTQRHGIVLFLLMIHQMTLIARPSVETHGGLLVKSEADNLFCLFDTVLAAIQASQEITSRLNVANILLPEDRRLYVSIGIGYGRILNIANEEVYGNEVNLASKLGEDVAEMAQILLTSAAAAQAKDAGLKLTEQAVSISGLSLPYFRLA